LTIRLAIEAKEKKTLEIPQEKVPELLRKPAIQPSLRKQKQTFKVHWVKVPKPPKKTIIQPFPSKQTFHPRKSRVAKGKGKVDNISQMVPTEVRPLSVSRTVDRTTEAPSSEIEAIRIEPEVVEISSRENIEVEQTGVVPEAHTDAMYAALKRDFFNALTSSIKFLGRKSIIHEVLLDG
jgi:hypothetical protein